MQDLDYLTNYYSPPTTYSFSCSNCLHWDESSGASFNFYFQSNL